MNFLDKIIVILYNRAFSSEQYACQPRSISQSMLDYLHWIHYPSLSQIAYFFLPCIISYLYITLAV